MVEGTASSRPSLHALFSLSKVHRGKDTRSKRSQIKPRRWILPWTPQQSSALVLCSCPSYSVQHIVYMQSVMSHKTYRVLSVHLGVGMWIVRICTKMVRPDLHGPLTFGNQPNRKCPWNKGLTLSFAWKTIKVLVDITAQSVASSGQVHLHVGSADNVLDSLFVKPSLVCNSPHTQRSVVPSSMGGDGLVLSCVSDSSG